MIKLPEGNVNGKLSGSRFQMLHGDYEQERAGLREELSQLNEEITQQEERAENSDRLISKGTVVSRLGRADALCPELYGKGGVCSRAGQVKRS